MPSAWIEHVKKYASENGVSYRQAMKDSKATYVSQAKPKAPPKPRAPPKPKEPKGPPKPRGRPRKLTEREIQVAQGDTGAQLFEEAKSRMKEKDLRKLEKKRKSPKRKVKVIKYDEEEEWDENAPMNFTAVEKQEEMAPAFETPFKQPPTLFIPDPYIGRISKQKVGELASKLSAIKRQTKKPEKLLYKNPLLEREIKTQRAKKLKEEDVRLSKLQDKAIAKSEMEEMGRAEEIQQMERALIREKRKIKPLDIVAEKEKRRMARYKKESDKIIAKAKKDKEFEKIMKSYGVPKSRKQILEERAGDWSSEF